MTEPKYKSCVLFGGDGFIGSHYAAYLLENNLVGQLTITDINPAHPDLWPKPLVTAFAAGKINYVQIDVRQPIHNDKLPHQVDLIVNLAAVHREPGHEAEEYFATNIPGAENVCNWAEQVGCKRIIFTSSIATYGAIGKNTEEKTEESLPVPLTPYGISKLVAEKIHIAWQRKDPTRKLLIVRPGVIFGPNEKGNVTRMVRALLGRYFFYTGTQEVRKAGGYVKELCEAMEFMSQWADDHNEPVTLFNFTMDPPPSVREFAENITAVAGIKRKTFNLPFHLLLWTSYLIHGSSKILGKPTSINPARVKKLLRSNNIVPQKLRDSGYIYHYSLLEGLKDWQKSRPEEW